MNPTLTLAAQRLRELIESRAPRRDELPALLGDAAGTVALGDGTSDVWVRLYGVAEQKVRARNTRVAEIADLPVKVVAVKHDQRIIFYEIVGLDGGKYPGETQQPFGLPAHADSHMLMPGGTTGWDAVSVTPRALTPLRCNAQATPDLTVRVQPGYYFIESIKYYAGGDSPAFTADGYSFDVLCLDAAGNFSILTGTHGFVGFPLALPTIPPDKLPLCAVALTPSLTAITEEELWNDPRPFLSLPRGSAYAMSKRVVPTGESLTIPDTYSLCVASYFNVQGTGQVRLEGDAALEVIG